MKVPEGYVLVKKEYLDKLEASVLNFEALVSKLEARIQELEARLNLNSKNSHKPPSTDGLNRKNSLREKSGKKSGAQPGHTGTTLKMVAFPDIIEEIIPDGCNHCGGRLYKAPNATEVRQVIDIPVQRAEVTEYHAHSMQCKRCGKISKGKFPESAQHSVQYGNRIKAFIAYLSSYHMIPQARLSELIKNVYGVKLSGGMIHNSILKASSLLQENRDEIKNIISQSKVVGFDETGLYVNKSLKWMHTASTGNCTLLTLHDKRGTMAIDEIGILPEFMGVAVHDRWASYFKYSNCTHALCNAHILRDLNCLQKEWDCRWAGEMIDLLLKAKLLTEQDHPPSESAIKEIEQRYSEIVAWGLRQCTKEGNHTSSESKRGRPKQSKPKNLLDDFKAYKDSFLLFLNNTQIPFDNNGSERDVRMAKVKMKVSGGFRSREGAEAFVTIRSYINTVIKNKRDALQELINAFNGNAFLPNLG